MLKNNPQVVCVVYKKRLLIIIHLKIDYAGRYTVIFVIKFVFKFKSIIQVILLLSQ